MNKLLLGAACACFVVGCSKAPEVPRQGAAPAVPALVSGIDVQYVDASTRPQDDFFKHINGKWLATTDIPADKGSYGTFDELFDDSEGAVAEHRRRFAEVGRRQGCGPAEDRRPIRQLHGRARPSKTWV